MHSLTNKNFVTCKDKIIHRSSYTIFYQIVANYSKQNYTRLKNYVEGYNKVYYLCMLPIYNFLRLLSHDSHLMHFSEWLLAIGHFVHFYVLNKFCLFIRFIPAVIYPE